jgi:outer membrane protein assembly factor BamB
MLWNTYLPDSFSSPLLSADSKTVYLGSSDNHLYAIATVDGTPRWTFQTGSFVNSNPALSRDQRTIYVGSDDTNLYAVNAADGKQLWQFGTGAQVLSTPAVSTDQQII